MSYEISDETLAIVPYGKSKAKVLEYDCDYILDDNPYSIMEYSCEYFGSSLDGRIIGSRNMLGTIYKVPLIVEDSRNIIFFPTKSPNANNNIWVSLNNIDEIRKKNKKTVIVFKNKRELLVDVPYNSIDNQILRATRLESIYRSRKDDKKTVKM